MFRLSIEVTPEQHQRLKAIAALHGKTIKKIMYWNGCCLRFQRWIPCQKKKPYTS